jgi:hypothetical protein
VIVHHASVIQQPAHLVFAPSRRGAPCCFV